MLRQHMRQHHPKPTIPEDAGAAFLIDRVAASQSGRISIPLCDEVHEVRKYRNSLMHPDGARVMELPFTVALARLAAGAALNNPYEQPRQQQRVCAGRRGH